MKNRLNQEKDGVDIFVGVPIHKAEGSYKFRDYLDRCLRYMYAKGYTVKLAWSQSSLLPENRIHLAQMALKSKALYAMFFDSDQTFQEDIIEQLMRHGKPIVSAMYFQKSWPYRPLLLDYFANGRMYKHVTEWKEGELREVDACGGGGLFVETAIFNRIPKPWFCVPPNFLRYDGAKRKFYIDAEALTDKYDNNLLRGEDAWFCHVAKEAGFPIFVDTGVIMGHIGDHVYSDRDFAVAKESGAFKEITTDTVKMIEVI